MIRIRTLLLLLPIALVQVGCASSGNSPDNTQAVDANGQPVSSVPWNKPESWETSGQLGGLNH